ncbi:ketohydroxyglutarate aldolase [Stakelama saccharophila]|uniref:Ketohydroxyglutarate aldolase n=1 Tax=Stakelama saccharophila TaxID=3075605 RepID=A0ABZ0BAZ8_9SPHN|nr:ketohydroxyglutarate aldolase [Stakelama sp. W311]WNO54591.1 ketohydroxyglutarate aldolase [Stakelama sp. W311]
MDATSSFATRTAPNRRRSGWRYRANVAARTIAALVGGYVVAALFAFATARLIPLARVEAVMPGTLLAFLVAPGVAIWAFLARSATRALAGVVGVAAILALLGWMAGPPV